MHEFFTSGWDDLVGRLTGPMQFRLILQPLVAILLAIRSGWRDAREHRPPFLWGVILHPEHRDDLLRHGLVDVGRVFLLAVALDVVYQVIVFKWVFPLQTLIVAIVLALVPYLIARSLANRAASALRPRP